MAWEQHSHADGETFTADDMNRMEEAIYGGGGYSSKKEWADQNVPGVENWNRLENGILAIGSDAVSKNLCLNTQKLDSNAYYNGTAWTYYGEEDGFGVLTAETTSSPRNIYIVTDTEMDGSLVGETVSMSVEIKASADSHVYRFYPAVLARNSNNNSWTIKYYLNLGNLPVNGINADTWTRLTLTTIWPAVSEMTQNTATEYALYRYAFAIVTRSSAGAAYMRKPKLEINSAATNWSPNPADLFTIKTWESEQDENNIINADNANRWEQGITDMLDYREKYATEETETANPQSIPDDTEDSDEVAAPEAEEIE